MRTFDEAYLEYQSIGASRAPDDAVMAAFCKNTVQLIVGAVSPRLVWEGAMKRKMTALELATMAHKNPMAVGDLQWI